MDLVIIRHALPVRRITEGSAADPELTELGLRQADATAEWLSAESFDAIYMSTMLRARQTAAPIAAKQGLEPIPDEGIAEYDRQSEFYIPIEEVKASDDPELKAHWQALAEDRLEDVIADAHTFKPRVIGAFQKIIDDHPGQRVLAICHGGVINVALGWVLDHPRTLWFEPSYASIHRVAASRAGIKSIVSINETGHLRGIE
jgi:2,3-bisphosphoglycerate-dependent phosphoglycerate mutase